MLMATAAATELMKSMERDDEATRFHTDTLNHCLKSAEGPDFHC